MQESGVRVEDVLIDMAAAAQEINTGEVPCFLHFISNQSQHSSEEEEEEEEEEGNEGLPHG